MDTEILNKLDGIKDGIHELDKKLVAHDGRLANIDTNLAEHMRRTEQNETQIATIAAELKPIQQHVWYIHGGLKVVGGLATLAGVIYYGVQIVRAVAGMLP